MMLWEISLIAVLGLVFGSFLNVCIARLPEGESIVHPRSHCPHCGHLIAWYDNIPVLSWLFLRAHCRACNGTISLQYPLIEIGTAGLWIACWRAFFHPGWMADFSGAALQTAGMAALCFLLLGLAVMDWETLLLPEAFTYPGIVLGFLWQTTRLWSRAEAPGQNAKVVLWLLARIAIATLGILLIRWIYQLIRHREGMGLGDAKLMAMLTAWLGLKESLLVFFLAVVCGALFSLGLMVASKGNQEKWAERQVPLGTFLCLAGLYAIFFGPATLRWYLSFL